MSIIHSVTPDLLAYIQLFLTYRETAASFYRVCQWWNGIVRSDRRLDVSGQPIKNTDAGHVLNKFQNKVQALNLSYCQKLTSAVFVDLGKLKHLCFLDLSFCSFFSGEDLIHLQDLPLQSLSLSMCKQVKSVHLRHLTTLPLETLFLRETSIDDGACEYLQKIASLRRLYLSWCKKITDTGLKSLSSIAFVELDLAWCRISDKGVKCINTMSLNILDLTWCKKVGDKGLAYLRKTHIKDLRLIGCAISIKGLSYLRGLPLMSLDLSHCKGLGSKMRQCEALVMSHVKLYRKEELVFKQ